MDCSEWRAFQTTAQPRAITMSTNAAVRAMLDSARSSFGSEPGASTGTGLGFSRGWANVEGVLASSTAIPSLATGFLIGDGANFSSTMTLAGVMGGDGA